MGRKNKYNLTYRTLTKDELGLFKKITSDTCDRRSFNDKSLEYYENMYDCFGENVTFKIVELNCDSYIKILEDENKENKRKIRDLSDSVSNKKKKEMSKKVKSMWEETKAKFRVIRQDAMKATKKLLEDKEISENENKVNEANIDELTKEYNTKVDNLVKAKSDEVMKI